ACCLAGQHEENSLAGVIDVVGVRETAATNTAHHAPVTLHQFRERGFIADINELLEQNSVGNVRAHGGARRDTESSKNVLELLQCHDAPFAVLIQYCPLCEGHVHFFLKKIGAGEMKKGRASISTRVPANEPGYLLLEDKRDTGIETVEDAS